jgi:fumarate hydratase class II
MAIGMAACWYFFQVALGLINEYVERSLMLVTALSPVIGYDKASKIGLVPSTRNLRKLVQPWVMMVIECAMLKIINGL